MEFKVRFESYRGWAVNLQDHTSITLLDKTRGLFNLPQFPMEKVKPVQTMYGSWTCSLNEDQAKACGHFNDKETITVSVDSNQLNQFSILKKHRHVNQHPDGSYDYIRAEWSIDEKKLLNHWFLADCPLDWTKDEEEEEGDSDVW